MISKAAFESQRGSEEVEPDLVFGPLDQDDLAVAAASAKVEELAEQRAEVEQRRRVQDSEGHGKLPPNGSPSLHSHQRRKKDGHARFYPVLNKQDSPSKVG